jgi:hypothetical protein
MRRLLPILIFGFSAASVLIYFFGDSGLFAYRSLAAYKESLATNVARLEERNTGLALELASLQTSPERNTVLARGIGLFRPGDRVVKLEGFAARREFYPVGDLIKLRKHKERKSAIFKAAGVGLSILMAALIFCARLAPRARLHGRKRG